MLALRCNGWVSPVFRYFSNSFVRPIPFRTVAVCKYIVMDITGRTKESVWAPGRGRNKRSPYRQLAVR